MPKKRPEKIDPIADIESGFKVGDRVTCRSIKARSMILGTPTELELANYPSLVGVELTIDRFEGGWIVCTRASGSFTPGLLAEDLEIWGKDDEP